MAGGLSDDRSLLERIRRGDAGGAEELFERYAPALLRFASRMLSDRETAEEVTQEVFVKVISRAHQYDGRSAVSSWLFAIAANACRDRRRRDRRATIVPLEAVGDLPARGEGAEALFSDRQRRFAVRRALDRERPGDLGGSRQDPNFPRRRDPQGALFRRRSLMECRELTIHAVNRLVKEADASERDDLERHLAGCPACSRELAAIEETWEMLGTDRDDRMTPEFRRSTVELLEDEMFRRRIRSFRPRRRALRVLAQAAALAVATSAGFLVAARGGFSSKPAPTFSPVGQVLDSKTPPDLAVNPRLSNVAYRTEPDGRVGIEFDSTTRHSVLGRPEDPQVSRLLAYLLSVNVQTAGEKSQAIELVSGHSGAGAVTASPDVVGALAMTLKRDRNPGVRKKAAEALASFRSTPEIRAALLEALANDPNPGVRLVAVEALAASANETPDPKTIQSLREKAFDPQENGFVRARAASALKSIDL